MAGHASQRDRAVASRHCKSPPTSGGADAALVQGALQPCLGLDYVIGDTADGAFCAAVGLAWLPLGNQGGHPRRGRWQPAASSSSQECADFPVPEFWYRGPVVVHASEGPDLLCTAFRAISGPRRHTPTEIQGEKVGSDVHFLAAAL